MSHFYELSNEDKSAGEITSMSVEALLIKLFPNMKVQFK